MTTTVQKLQRLNLVELSRKLRDWPAEKFNMTYVVNTRRGEPTWPYLSEMPELEDGDTVCALGLAMLDRIGVDPESREVSALYFADSVFGLNRDTDGWNYLFHGSWVNVDNTPTGAADRIDTYLKSGVPDGFSVDRLRIRF